MRPISLLLILLTVVSTTSAQKKYLVSPNYEVIPITGKETAASIMRELNGHKTSSPTGTCYNQYILGFPPWYGPPVTSNFGAYHLDAIGNWMVAPVTGRIDTIWWEALGSVGATDSLLYVAIHKSEIGPSFGPGVRPGPYP